LDVFDPTGPPSPAKNEGPASNSNEDADGSSPAARATAAGARTENECAAPPGLSCASTTTTEKP